MSPNTSLHDTHVHLEILLEKLGFLENSSTSNAKYHNELARLIEKHEFVLQSTVSTENYLQVKQLFTDFDKIKYFLGSHPEIVDTEFDLPNYLSKQEKILQSSLKSDFVGIGEIGLDYFYTRENVVITKQKDLFESQIQLAIKLNLPIMIHCREAFADLFNILNKYPQVHNKFLIHCFTGGVCELHEAIKIGGVVAFGGICTFNSATKLHEAIIKCPLDRFVLETDLPFLAPTPFRGRFCEPNMIDKVAEKVAELKNVTKSEIWQNSLSNTKKLFII